MTIYLVIQTEDNALVNYFDRWIDAQVECSDLCEYEPDGYHIEIDCRQPAQY